MCGNFGLLILRFTAVLQQQQIQNRSNLLEGIDDSFHKLPSAPNDLDQSLHESMHRVSKMRGLILESSLQPEIKEELINFVDILQSQTACTEIRGGQAGGFSSLEYKFLQSEHKSRFDALFAASIVAVPCMTRVRMVARKRHPLAADLAELYVRERGRQEIADPNSPITVIGHTRFATSSINQVPELHPHEWSPFHEEDIWQFNNKRGRFERVTTVVGIHITHNGDFDAMEAYAQSMVIQEIGLWLERVLHVSNSTRGDSAKLAGCMEVFRVQGRWAAAARLAWIRCVLNASVDVTGGELLNKDAANVFPGHSFWNQWSQICDKFWSRHINNVVKVVAPSKFDMHKVYCYSVDEASMKQLCSALIAYLQSDDEEAHLLGVSTWSTNLLTSFVHHMVRGFLHGDLYNAMTELLSRAEGSFGIQVHCTLEPGVVVIASKGQPMSIAFDPKHPIVLFASEAEALAVPVFKSGRWLPERIDLDAKGEVFRVGSPRYLIEGTFLGETATFRRNKVRYGQETFEARPTGPIASKCIRLACGVEIRAYSLVYSTEATATSLSARSVSISTAPVPYDPKVDLVGADLKVTPAVLAAIDHAWANASSLERVAGEALAQQLLQAMKRRASINVDTIDLLIAGVEVSLWLAEQLAADLHRVFPHLNVVTSSANKLLGLGDDNPSKVFFPTAYDSLERKIDDHTCVLLISQSGQTFPTLHATRKVARLVPGRVWIVTGCFNSKMEQALIESYQENGWNYARDRVFNNYSGHRPAEPSSVAVASTWHTLTRILLQLVYTVRAELPGRRLIHDWEGRKYGRMIVSFLVYSRYKLLKRRRQMVARKQMILNSKTEELKEGIDSNMSVVKLKGCGGPHAKHRGMEGDHLLMNLTDGCIEDFRSLLQENLIPNICEIVGHDMFGQPIVSQAGGDKIKSTHDALVNQGKAWAAHINESWHVMVYVGVYLLLSVGLGLPIIGLIADAILAIVRAGGGYVGAGYLMFTPRVPSLMYHQSVGFTLIGLAVQMLDALFFVYLGKNFTRLVRLITGRPLAARHGKRTIVIVDNPCVHQLMEIFVSKLFSQSYSIVSVDVHGASGLDHFVHRFTHRVVRGLLIAVGRPDGRMCCLAKSEASVILATKQAAFIRNPDYGWEGSGPEIVCIGHNPYSPNLGLSHNIVLHGGAHHEQSNSLHHQTMSRYDIIIRQQNRRKFVDEYLYDRLFLAQKPFTTSILRSLRRAMDKADVCQGARKRSKFVNRSLHPFSDHSGHAMVKAVHRKSLQTYRKSVDEAGNPLPYGVHHIDPDMLTMSKTNDASVMADFVAANWKQLIELAKTSKKQSARESMVEVEVAEKKSYDPAVRLAFLSRVEASTRRVLDLQVVVQQLYECRIASLERYLAFCVMFHAMAKDCCDPWLLKPWDMARSQSNLRVATTASPIGAGSDGSASSEASMETKLMARRLALALRKVIVNF